MKENIYKAIEVQSGKISFKNISKKFDIDTEELKRLLLELKLEGKILQIGNKYMLFPKDLSIGTIARSTSGRKYLYHDNLRFSIASNFLDKVILNDVVSFRLNENNEAEIISIIDRKLGKMTCQVMLIDGKKTIVPYHEGVSISLPLDIINNLYDGDIILVDTTPNELGEVCDAKFLRKLGSKNDPLPKDVEIALNYEFDNIYTPEYLEEIKRYPRYVSESEVVNRHDFRYQPSFTIDGENTKDMDDGVYAEVLDNSIIRVYVHIADVSHYVKTDSLVFKRACEKATSLYMNNSVFHMLHQVLSNGICSLNPYEDRLTKTVIMDIDVCGNIVNYDIVKSVINSKKKMAYGDVDEVLAGNMIPGYESFTNTLAILNEAAIRLERRYTEDNGKITFENNELNITYNQDGTIKRIEDSEHSQSRKLIENLMIAANETVASWFFNMDIPTVYRIHEFPNVSKVNRIIDEINKSGYHVKHINNADDSKTIQRLLDRLKNVEGFDIISQLLITSMQRARYSTENVGHYALGLDSYLHFTSPIRRLPDLLVHIMTDLVLEHYDKLTSDYLTKYEAVLRELSIHSSRMERQADMAEAAAEKRLIIEKLSKEVGAELEAIICETDRRIRIKVSGIDTYIDKSNLSEDFAFDSRRKLFYDKQTGSYLKMGTKVIVQLTSTNVANQTVGIMVLGTESTYAKKKVLKRY